MKALQGVRLLLGDMQALDQALETRSRTCSPLWILLDGAVAALRGIAQVIFVNNPLSGALMLAGLTCSSVLTGLAALTSVVTAILVSKLLEQPRGAVRAGLTSFSACLVGTVTVELVPLLYHRPADVTLFLWVVLMSALSVPVAGGLGNILGTFRLPAFTLPFNVVTSVLFLCLLNISPLLKSDQSPEPAAINATAVAAPALHWDQVFEGVLCSMGQVWASYTMVGSVLIYLGCLLCSPILTVASVGGALVGTLLGILFSGDSYDLVYAGVWGYNGILAAEAMLFFLVVTPRALLLSLLNAALATMIQAALNTSMAKIELPVFTFPFVLSTLLLLAMTSDGTGVRRVENLRFPEVHLRERCGRDGVGTDTKNGASSGGDGGAADDAHSERAELDLGPTATRRADRDAGHSV